MDGADALFHTASPFPLSQPRDENDIIRPAVDGTLRAMRAAQAAGVSRVVLTSSVVAIEATDKAGAYTEDDWSDPGHPKSNAYYKSKTMAERAAWDFVADNPEMQLTTINPALVLGEPMDGNYGTSLELVERILGGKDPIAARCRFRRGGRGGYLGDAYRGAAPPRERRAEVHRLERNDDHAADGATPRRTSSRPQDRDPDRAQAGAAAAVAVRPVDPWHFWPASAGRRSSTTAARATCSASSFTAPLAALEKAADAVLAKG